MKKIILLFSYVCFLCIIVFSSHQDVNANSESRFEQCINSRNDTNENSEYKRHICKYLTTSYQEHISQVVSDIEHPFYDKFCFSNTNEPNTTPEDIKKLDYFRAANDVASHL